jgi:Flp pilus assembly protein TadG
MKMIRKHVPRRASRQRGQTFIPIVFIIGLFLLAMLGIAADYTQLWAHRQMAQGAADAACEAGAADLYLNAIDPSASGQNGLQSFSWISSSGFDCTSNVNSPPCAYASLNGYTGSKVQVSFPSSLPGVAPLPSTLTSAHPYIEVTITDPIPMSFTKVVSSTSVVNVKARAGCGVIPVAVPIPLVILHPTAASALSVSGSSRIRVFGGPRRSIQVDSKDPVAISVGIIDLSQAGPLNTGADFAVFGGPQAQPATINTGSTGHYISPAIPFGDPFASIAAPSAPANIGSATPVTFGTNGCPDPNGCVEFTPGNYVGCAGGGNIAPGAQGCLMLPYTGTNPKFSSAAALWVAGQPYTAGALVQPSQHNAGNFIYQATNTGNAGPSSPNPWNQTICTRQPDGSCTGGTQVDGGITWRNIGVIVLNKLSTGIFDPGIYYVGANGLNLGSGSTARMSTANGDGSNGVLFYFSTSDTVSVTSNSGNASSCATASSGSGSPNGCVVDYRSDGTRSPAATGFVASMGLQCAGGSANPPQVPSTLSGNILLGPCSGTYASPDGNRGFLFFQNRATAAAPSWGGGGQFLSSGFMYFHSGVGSTCGSNTSCLTLQGGSGAQSYTLGNIVVDKLALGGNPQINMILSPNATFEVLKPTLLE